MKRLLVCVILVLAGCGTYYKPGVTLEQAVQDYRECYYEANRSTAANPMDGLSYAGRTESLCDQCMVLRGYSFISKNQVPANCRIKGMRGIWLAGE